nr:myosin heavy chain, muscle-like [Aegilops tauschii subsp. strangulata]
MEEHRTLMDAVVEKVQSTKSRLNEALTSLLTGFEGCDASLLAATAQAAGVSELNRKLKLADDEIDRINKRFDEMQVGAAEVETLKGTLAQAQKEAKANKAAADKVAAELKTEQAARRQHEARVAEVERELKDAILKCEGLEEKASAQSFELAKALQDAKAAQVESRSAHKEIHQAKQIAADLPRSATDAKQFF